MATEKRLIDANDALKEAQKVINEVRGNGILALKPEHCYKLMRKVLKDAPTVDAVEVVHGRYVHKGAWHIECSECKHILAHISEAKNYCPNCGAKMDLKGE